MRRLGWRAAAVLLGLLVALLAVEGAIRVRRLLRPEAASASTIVLDDELGWRVRDGIEAHAAGTGGHGTLQELLVLERSLDALDPDAVVLQRSSNDSSTTRWSSRGGARPTTTG